MNEPDRRSRLKKLEKRRKNTKIMSILMIIAGVLLFGLLLSWIFGGKNDEKSPDPETSEDQNDDDSSNSFEIKESEDDSDEDEEETDDQHIVETEKVDPSDDNVLEAYTGDWKIVETVQEEPHTINYSDGSQDRIEIQEAVMIATGLNENLITWRVGNGGDQKVVATVSDSDETKIYRVYLSWIENKGWQPTKVELLEKNDKR